MLTSKVVYEGVATILESLKNSDMESAKRMLETLTGEVKTEKERGSLLAAAGIYASMAKAKEGTLQTWNQEKITRAAQSIQGNQLSDEFDKGYAETLVSYSKLIEKKL